MTSIQQNGRDVETPEIVSIFRDSKHVKPACDDFSVDGEVGMGIDGQDIFELEGSSDADALKWGKAILQRQIGTHVFPDAAVQAWVNELRTQLNAFVEDRAERAFNAGQISLEQPERWDGIA